MGTMFKSLRSQVNHAVESRGTASEVGSSPELRSNPDDMGVELAGYWARLLLRVKRQSEGLEQEQQAEEVTP